MTIVPRALATALVAAAALAAAVPAADASTVPPATALPVGGPISFPAFDAALPVGGIASGAGPCGSASATPGQGATAGTSAQVCTATGLTYIGPAIGQVATVIGPTIIGPAVVGTVVTSAGNGVGG